MAERSEAPDRIPRGVGTKLVTAYDQPALGGVHKLGAMQNDAGQWQPRLKLSEQAIKTSTPGMLQIRRFGDGQRAVADMIYNQLNGDPVDATGRRGRWWPCIVCC